jgi:chromosome partitioning protein
MIVVVANTKGGAGKSSIAVNLAALRATAGRDVLLVDTDKQASSMLWSGQRVDAGVSPSVPTAAASGRGLPAQLADFAKRYGDLVVDTPGADLPELRMAMLAADVVVMPVQASQVDVWSFDRDMGSIIDQVLAMRPQLRLLAVINRAPTNAAMRELRDAQEFFEGVEHITLARAVLRDRVAVRRAFGEGLAVTEAKPRDEHAGLEMEQLYKEVFNVV